MTATLTVISGRARHPQAGVHLGGLSRVAALMKSVSGQLAAHPPVGIRPGKALTCQSSAPHGSSDDGAGGAQEMARLEIFTTCATTADSGDRRKRETDNVSHVGKLDKLQAQAKERFAGGSVDAVRWPEVSGVTQSGLNASADGENPLTVTTASRRARRRVLRARCAQSCRGSSPKNGRDDNEIRLRRGTSLWDSMRRQTAMVGKDRGQTQTRCGRLGAIRYRRGRHSIAAEPESPYAGLDPSTPTHGPPAAPAARQARKRDARTRVASEDAGPSGLAEA